MNWNRPAIFYKELSYYFNNKEILGNDDTEKKLPDILHPFFLNKIVVLTGAGSSVELGLPTMKELIKEIGNSLENSLKDKFNEIKKLAKKDEEGDDNLEKILTLIINKIKYCGENLQSLQKQIENIIIEKLTIPNEANLDPHKEFLRKLIALNRNKDRLKVFTTNYDLAFEKASKALGYMINDGFLLQNKYLSSSLYYDMIDKRFNHFINSYFYLYKLHGSLNWKKNDNGYDIEKHNNKENSEPLLIYPSKDKYENSYHFPFFDMLSALQNALQTYKTTLIIIGYSFGDFHINQIIEQAIDLNPTLHIIVISPDLLENSENTTNKQDTSSEEIKEQSPLDHIKNLIRKYYNRFILLNTNFQEFNQFIPSSFTKEENPREDKEDQNGIEASL